MNDLKKKTGKYAIVTMLFLLLAIVFEIQPAQAAVKLNMSAVNLCVGDKYQLKLTGTTKKVTWKSSKTSVAKVSSKGLVTARGKGSATITATCNKKNYSCKVKVNKTYKVSETSITISKNKELTAYLSVAGRVDRKIADERICAVEFDEWDGDNMPITIVPKKVGSTTITFMNTANSEYCTLNVKVTAIPSATTFQSASISTGADTLIVGESKLSVSFRLRNRASKKTYLKVYDENGAVVRSISIGEVKADKKKTVVWDGKDDDGSPLSGIFSYAIVADGNRTFAKKANGKGKAKVTVSPVSPFGKGDGTEGNPYLVSNLNELYMIKDYNGAYFAQDADIDFDYGVFAALFTSDKPFTGTFDGSHEGKKYRMVNLCGYNSIFGVIGEGGTVKNVSMNNCLLNITGSLLATTNDGTIDSCQVDGKVLCNAGNMAAMLVMYNKGLIRDCMVSGSLNVKADKVVGATTLKAGGIVFQNSGTIAKCQSSVQIVQEISVDTYASNTTHEIYSGGITAENASGAIVTECVFTGAINTSVTLSDTVKDVTPEQTYKAYSGFVAGTNSGYIGKCINASVGGSLGAQGTGNGTVQ